MEVLSHPITSIYDERLLGLPAIATDHGIPNAVVRWAPWVASYMARGRHDMLIARARFELPPPHWVWDVMEERTFDGLTTPEACLGIVRACGWSKREMLRHTGLAQFSGYPALALCTLIGIRSAENAVQDFTWRSFAARAERADIERGGPGHRGLPDPDG